MKLDIQKEYWKCCKAFGEYIFQMLFIFHAVYVMGRVLYFNTEKRSSLYKILEIIVCGINQGGGKKDG